MLFVKIDSRLKTATIGNSEDPKQKVVAKNGVFEAVCLLVSRKSDPTIFVTEAKALPYWSTRKTTVESVGKAIHKFVIDLGQIKFLQSIGKQTQEWQLTPAAIQAIDEELLSTSKQVVSKFSWNNPKHFADSMPQTVASWMENSVECLLKLTEGDPQASAELLQNEWAKPVNEVLKEITAVLDAKVKSRTSNDHPKTPATISPEMSAFEVAAAARRLASAAVASDSSEWTGYVERIQTALPAVSEKGYTTTAAVLLNALAVTEKRLDNMADALDHIKEAAPLAFFSGDLILIQQLSFNFANILWENWKIDPTICEPRDYERLLEIDIAIRQDHGIGRDSAQAEILAAYFRYEREDHAGTVNFLRIARSIIRSSKQRQDYAFYFRVTGLRRSRFRVTTQSLKNARKCLLKSAEYYRAVGNMTYAETATSEAEELALRLARIAPLG